MSRQFNTDGLLVFPPDNGEPITLNAFESIECAITFDVRDWSEDRRSAWIYAIVFGWDCEEWDEIAEKFGWDEEDRKRANMMHEQWIKAKHEQWINATGAKEQPEIVRCKYCKHQNEYRTCSCPFYTTWGSIAPDDWFCADGERKDDG